MEDLLKMNNRSGYGRWLEEMKDKISHVCSQNNIRVEWSQHKHSIRNFKS